MPEVQVNSEILEWARSQVSLTLDEAAEQLGVPTARLESWERQGAYPTQTAVEKMARLYQLPLAAFFLPSRPADAELPPDYRLRTVSGRRPRVTRELVGAVRDARAWQAVIARLEGFDSTLATPITIPEASVGDSPSEAGNDLRRTLGIGTEQLRWPDADHALGAWRLRVEDLGALVFAMRFDREVCRGFSMWLSAGPPVIALAAESPQARTFTLLHETAHLMLRGGGICTQFQDSSARGRLERYCNVVAASALMPSALVRQAISEELGDRPTSWDERSLGQVSRLLKVSVPALALRLEELGMADTGLYDRVAARSRNGRSAQSGGGAAWPGVRISERGTKFSRAVYEAWNRGDISTGDAARVMNLRPKYVREIGESLSRRRGRFG